MMSLPAPRSYDSFPHGAQELIRAAERLFGERGVEGVTIRELLEAAGQANKSAVHHYFGSKEELWIATLEYLFERYLETGRGLGFSRLL